MPSILPTSVRRGLDETRSIRFIPKVAVYAFRVTLDAILTASVAFREWRVARQAR